MQIDPIFPYPKIILVRHGETHWNKMHRFQGHQDSPLTLNGIAQAQAVAKNILLHIDNVQDYEVWSSPIGRAHQTAAIISEKIGWSYENIQFSDALRERSFGEWEGKTLSDIKLNYKENFDKSRNDPWGYAIPGGGESFEDVRTRLKVWLSNRSKETPIIAIIHSGSGRVLRNLYTNAERSEILTYNEAQTSSFILDGGNAQEICPSSELLSAMGCDGEGIRIAI